ncbi:MAG: metallophosphoesterase [Syntrophorhabdales bacterium]
MRKLSRIAVITALVVVCVLAATVRAEEWKFGIIGDTQWTGADDGRNPYSCAVDIINRINRQFIDKKVKFVIAVGDLADKSTDQAIGKLALDTRATYAQALYNAHIGFFPFRGNHEDSAAAASEFRRIFPQTQDGLMNSTPIDAFVRTSDDGQTHPVAKGGPPFAMGSGFSSPSSSLRGLSYAFSYRNATFVMLDQFIPPDKSPNTVGGQQGWINEVLQRKATDHHAFVFGHKGLLTESHGDTLFGGTPASHPADQDAFILALAAHGVRYYICGHDHMHDRSRVTTTDGRAASVTQIVSASASSKFYIPARPSNDDRYDAPAFGHTRQIPFSQELDSIGYYIVTVNGPKVTVDYYSAPVKTTAETEARTISMTPPLRFTRRETFGYSLNGKEFLVAQGESYTGVQDSFSGTTARILSGLNKDTAKDGSGRPLTKAVTTGWVPGTSGTMSHIVTLWGMAGVVENEKTDVFTLSMTYRGKAAHGAHGRHGVAIRLATRDAGARWINAVDKNAGGTKRFVSGPWTPSCGLGAYGFDPDTHTAWAVMNHAGDFAVVENVALGHFQKK